MYETPRFDDLYGPYNQTQSAPVVQPQAPPVATPPPVHPFNALMAALLAPTGAAATNASAPQIPWHDIISAVINPSALRDPQGYANKVTQLPSYAPGSQSPFNTGFFNNTLKPEAALASQGLSATAQWGLRGGVAGIDPHLLRSLMRRPPATY